MTSRNALKASGKINHNKENLNMSTLKNATGNDRTVTLTKEVTRAKNWREDARFGGPAKPKTTYFVEVSYSDTPHLDFFEKRDTLAAAKRTFRTWAQLCD